MSDQQMDEAAASESQPLPNMNDQKRNSSRSKDSEIVIGQLNKIIRMKKQMKKNKLVVQDKVEKPREKSPISPFIGNKNYLDLKAQFTAQLPKLNSLDTRQAALKELESIIETNKTPESLRVYLSTLSEYKRPQNFSTNEAEVFLLGLICDSYGTNLLDALDNPPNLFNTCMRMGELISRYFKDQNENVQRQCCKTWKQMYRSQLLNSSLKNKMMVLYEIPASIISGGKDRVAQDIFKDYLNNKLQDAFLLIKKKLQYSNNFKKVTAVMVIEGVLDFGEKISDKELLGTIAKKYLPSIYFRLFLDTPSLVTCAKLIVSSVLIKNLSAFLNQILEKTISFLLPQESRPISYKIRIEVCDFLTVLARQLFDISSTMIGQYQDQIIPILQECIKDRMLKVQSSAKQALKEWQALKQKVEELEKKKLTKKSRISKDYLDPDEIINSKTVDIQDQVSQLKKRPKQQTRTIILENENGIKNVLNKQGGWVNELKAKNFIRKQTGVGGGRTVINEDRLKIQKTAINQQQKVRDFILGQYKDIRDDLKTRKQQQQENNEQTDVAIYYKQQREDQEDQNIQNTNNISNNMVVSSNIGVVSRRETIDNYSLQNNENVSNNFYNSQIQNLQKIQKTQQQLIEDQLKLYPHYREDRNFVVPPQTIHPSIQNELLNNNNSSSSQTKQRYQQAQPDYFNEEMTQQQQQYYHENKQIQPSKLQVISKSNLSLEQDMLEETQDFNNSIEQKSRQVSSNTPPNLNNKSISQLWEEAIYLADDGDLDQAFTLILDSEDDIYFVRLLMRTGMQLEKLKRTTAVRAIQRFLLIQKSNFVNKLCFGFYQNSIDSGLQDHLLVEDQREMHSVIGQLGQSQNLENRSMASNLLSSLNNPSAKY